MLIRLFNGAGLNVALKKDYYSPLPVLGDLRRHRARWDKPSQLVGVSVDVQSIGSYFKFNLDYMTFYNLIRIQDNSDNRRAYQIASEYRRRNVPVIMGGFHATLLPDEVGPGRTLTTPRPSLLCVFLCASTSLRLHFVKREQGQVGGPSLSGGPGRRFGRTSWPSPGG